MSRLTRLLLALLLAAFPMAATADPGLGNGGSFVTAANTYTISSSGTVTIKNQPGTLYGISVLGTTQLVSLNCYDNASAASGTLLFSRVIVLSSPDWLPTVGVTFNNGLTCADTSVLGNGIDIFYR